MKLARDKYENAFTLAEVLITLLIIGVISSIVIPSLINSTNNAEIKTALKKSFATLNEALKRTKYDNSNIPLRCYYHLKNPYGAAKCANYNEEGHCTGWTFLDGSPLPSDYNGYFSECSKLLPEIKKFMVVSKTCAPGTAISDGCIPQYKGNDQVMLDNNLGNAMYTQVNANMATSGCGGWNTSNFASKEAVVLASGMTIIPYSSQFASSPIVGVDVNGRKGPNKAGYDLFFFETRGTIGDSRYMPGGCGYVEKGGHHAGELVYN
jgi:prepilin-type N-terminal cleavage/methylation domain-containing protein